MTYVRKDCCCGALSVLACGGTCWSEEGGGGTMCDVRALPQHVM